MRTQAADAPIADRRRPTPSRRAGTFAALAGLLGGRGRGAPSNARLGRLLIATAAALIALALPAAASAVPPPTFTIGPVTGAETTRAHVTGNIDFKGCCGFWFFETSTNGIDWTRSNFGGTSEIAKPVEGTLEGLIAGQANYRVRLNGFNFGEDESVAQNYSAVQTFSTDPAPVATTVTLDPATSVAYTTAQLHGSIDPEGGNKESGGAAVPVHWELQLSPSGDPGTFHPRNSGFLSEADAESNPGPGVGIPVGADLEGLIPGHTYTFRFVVTYGGQPVEPAPEAEFTTLPVAKPSVSGIQVSGVTTEAAHFSAEVDPNAPESEPVADPAAAAAFATNWYFSCTPSCFGLGSGDIAADDSSHPVANDAVELDANTTYTVRLVASNAGGATEVTETFHTGSVGPEVISLGAGPLTPTTAELNGEVNPRGSDTVYWYEWGSSNCESNPCVSTPHRAVGQSERQQLVPTSETYSLTFKGQSTTSLQSNAAEVEIQEALEGLSTIGPGNVVVTGGAIVGAHRYQIIFRGNLAGVDVPLIAADTGSVEVRTLLPGGFGGLYIYSSAQIAGLEPETTYHFRLFAESDSGKVVGGDREFTTPGPEPDCRNQGLPGSAFLFDCRGYEMVSPPEKNGNNLIVQTRKTHVRPDGGAVTFSSLGAFGETPGSSVDVEYLARRTGTPATSGWSTHGINPAGRPQTFNAAAQGAGSPTFVDAFTPDLSSAVYRSWRPLVPGAMNPDVPSLYRIDGLDGGPSSIELLSDSFEPVPSTWSTFNEGFPLYGVGPHIAGASEDLSQVFFESVINLTADAPPYSLFCSLIASGCPTKLYENVGGTVRLLGRVPSGADQSCDDQSGSPCVAAEFSQTALPASNEMYSKFAISRDGRRVYFIAPGGIYLREDGHRTERISPGGEFWAASADGSRAFFTTTEALLAADKDGAGADLYMYDHDASPGSRLVLVSNGTPADTGAVFDVYGASQDGDTVYFTYAYGRLLARTPDAFGSGLYVWHDGKISYVGHVSGGSENGTRSGWSGITGSKTSRISPDGRYLLFSVIYGAEGLAGRGGFGTNDDGGHSQFFVYDRESGRLSCATCHPDGEPGTTNPEINLARDDGISGRTSDAALALTDDGHFAFFSTGDALLSEDTNGAYDAYEYDIRTGEVHLLSSGTDSSDSFVLDATSDGSDVYIVTRERLVGWDRDGAYDLYDARVNGGFPNPVPVPDACLGDSCLPRSVAAPSSPAASSEAHGSGNPATRRTCPEGRRPVRRKGKLRCVKKPNHKRSAKHDRRTDR